jgi:hypothetical protein
MKNTKQKHPQAIFDALEKFKELHWESSKDAINAIGIGIETCEIDITCDDDGTEDTIEGENYYLRVWLLNYADCDLYPNHIDGIAVRYYACSGEDIETRAVEL